MTTLPASREMERLWRACAPEALAALVRRYGDFGAAEDAVQDALIDAARQWPEAGIPENPRGWLITVASRRLMDRRRRDGARASRERVAALREPPAGDGFPLAPTQTLTSTVTDERDHSLTLLLLCCHPALSRASAVALTLRAVGGLSTAQIAHAFLVPESTMAQRISRAKARLREINAPFAPPAAEDLPGRVAGAAHVLYLIFTEGHTATMGTGLADDSLAAEAIRLTRLLHEQLPSADEVTGLLALMLLTHARRAARVAADGSLVPLAEQDRSTWDRSLIAEGIRLVEGALPAGPVGPYQLQAAIAAVHAEAPRAEDTEWRQIEALYQMLVAIAPGPVVTLNHAVAVAMVDGPRVGLAMVEPLMVDPRMRRTHRLHAVRAHLLEMDGQIEEARDAYELAARMATSIPEQRHLNGRAERLGRKSDS